MFYFYVFSARKVNCLTAYMSYRKFKADKIFTGFELLGPEAVLVANQQGVIEGVVGESEAGDDIQTLRGVLSPAFINCHCHLELSHMKGFIPENTGMTDFVLNVVQQRHFSEEVIKEAMVKAEEEMWQNGIIAVGDICNNDLGVAKKKQPRLHYHNFIEASGFVPSVAAARFSRAREIFDAYASISSSAERSNSIVPHAPYSVSPGLFGDIVEFPGNHLLSMHNQECIAEEQLFLNRQGDFLRMYDKMNIDAGFFNATGKNSLQSVFHNFHPHQSLILVHNVTTTSSDINFLKSKNKTGPAIFLCLCVNANLYIGNGLPDINMLASSGFTMVLGTDSLASNHQLSILEEMKTIHSHYPEMELKELLQWATINGARALEMDKQLGSFEKGKRPGIVLIDTVSENEWGTGVSRIL